MIEKRKEQAQRNNQKIRLSVPHHSRVVQTEKGGERFVENKIYRCAGPCQHSAQVESCRCIGRGLFHLFASQRMGNFYLPAQPRDGGQAIGKPQIHARSTYGSHSAAAHTANPNHIGKVVRHLNKLRGHDGKGQLCQRGQDAPVKKIYFLHASHTFLQVIAVCTVQTAAPFQP